MMDWTSDRVWFRVRAFMWAVAALGLGLFVVVFGQVWNSI